MAAMQKRLTTRDTILYTLLALMVLLLVLLMYQIDRQWNKLNEMQVAVSEQAKDVQGVRSSISSLQSSFGDVVASVSSAAASKVASSVSPAANGESSKSPSTNVAANKITSEVPPAFQRAYKATQKSDYAQGGWKVSSFSNTVKTITPLVSADSYASDIQANVLESLLIRDPDTLGWTGLIAKDWTVSDDGLTIVFNLRENVRFSDGVPLTAEDVAFTYSFIMNESIKAQVNVLFMKKLRV